MRRRPEAPRPIFQIPAKEAPAAMASAIMNKKMELEGNLKAFQLPDILLKLRRPVIRPMARNRRISGS